jgi:hypothetical protein
MGLLTNILLAPFLGPVWGTRWTLEKVDRVVREELTDDTPIKEDLMALQLQLEMGEIDDAEYARRRSCSDFARCVSGGRSTECRPAVGLFASRKATRPSSRRSRR